MEIIQYLCARWSLFYYDWALRDMKKMKRLHEPGVNKIIVNRQYAVDTLARIERGWA